MCLLLAVTEAFVVSSKWINPPNVLQAANPAIEGSASASAVTATKEELFVNWMTTDSLKEIPHPGVQLEVIGSIPSYVKGVYIKNGPGAFSTPDGSRRYTHAFDGLAKLQKFDIDGDKVTFTTKFVDSRIKQSMLGENKIPGHLSTGPVEPPFPWWDVLLNTLLIDNASVNIEELSSSGTFCAVTDAALRQEFDITTLETIRRFPEGRIKGTIGVTQFSTAHSKVAKKDGLTYNYYLDTGLENWAHIVRTDKDLTQTSIGKVKVGRKFSYVHEISVSDNYAVLVLCPLMVDMGKLIQKANILPFLEFDPAQSTKICIFDLDGKKPVEIFEAQPLWCYHHVNAYEVDSKVVLDLLAYDTPGIANGPHGYLYMDNMKSEETRMKQEYEGTVFRFVLDLNDARRTVEPERKIVFDDDTGLPCVMELISVAPDVLGKPYRYVYGFTGFYKGTAGYMDWAIRKQDVAMNTRHGVWYEEFMYPGEVTFVRDPNGVEEDEGLLLSTVYDSRRGENCLLVLDATNMQELARAYTGVGL